MFTRHIVALRKIYIFLFLFSISGVVSMLFFSRTVLAPVSMEMHPLVWDAWVQKLHHTANTLSLHKPVSLVSPVQAAAPYDSASSYIAIDLATGNILMEKNSAQALPIASLTKIMTAIVALDVLSSADEITISQKASSMQPTKIGVVPGEKMTLDELLHAMLMTSANDAAQAIMDGVDAHYGKNFFIQAMNEKARFLGLTSTHFANPEGFDDTHNKSSAADLALLSSYALSHYPHIANIVTNQYVHLPASTLHKQFDLYNWNGLLGVYPGIRGMKIGNTDDAKYTTAVAATRENHTIIAVLLGAPNILSRDTWTASLLDDAFSSMFHLAPIRITPTALEAKYATWRYWD